MGLLDQVVGALANGQSAQGNPLLDVVMQLVNNPQTGGLAGLVAKLVPQAPAPTQGDAAEEEARRRG